MIKFVEGKQDLAYLPISALETYLQEGLCLGRYLQIIYRLQIFGRRLQEAIDAGEDFSQFPGWSYSLCYRMSSIEGAGEDLAENDYIQLEQIQKQVNDLVNALMVDVYLYVNREYQHMNIPNNIDFFTFQQKFWEAVFKKFDEGRRKYGLWNFYSWRDEAENPYKEVTNIEYLLSASLRHYKAFNEQLQKLINSADTIADLWKSILENDELLDHLAGIFTNLWMVLSRYYEHRMIMSDNKDNNTEMKMPNKTVIKQDGSRIEDTVL